MSKPAIAIAAAAMALALAACGARGPAGAPDTGNVLKAGNRSEVQDLDPQLVVGIAEHRALSSLFEGLVNLDLATNAPVPGAAESWTVSPGGLLYTFRLRAEGAWSDGSPLTAEDFVYSWRRMLTPALGAEYAYLLHCIENAKAFNEGAIADPAQLGVRALDAHTLEVVLENPTPYFLTMQVHSAWYPVPRAAIERFGPMTQRGSPWTRPGNHVGNGPFRLADWRPDEVLRVEKNPHYWGAAQVRLDGIAFYPISNEQTEERMFRTGALHLTYTMPMFRIPEWRASQPAALQIHPYLASCFYRFNVTRPPFDDPRVRRAFGMAVDREALAREVLQAGERPAYHWVPPDTAGYTCAYRVPQDAAQARTLLAEAGYPGGQGLRPIELLYNTAETDRLVAQALQQQWREALGAEVRLVNQDYKVYLDTMNRLDYDMARSIWLADVIDPVNFLECFLSNGGNNRTGWSDPEYDALIAGIYAEADAARRMALLQQAERRLLEAGVITPLFFMTQRYLQSPRVQGLTPNALGAVAWRDLALE